MRHIVLRGRAGALDSSSMEWLHDCQTGKERVSTQNSNEVLALQWEEEMRL
jgi:hypothetical protein